MKLKCGTSVSSAAPWTHRGHDSWLPVLSHLDPHSGAGCRPSATNAAPRTQGCWTLTTCAVPRTHTVVLVSDPWLTVQSSWTHAKVLTGAAPWSHMVVLTRDCQYSPLTPPPHPPVVLTFYCQCSPWPRQWCWPFTANAAPWPPQWYWPFTANAALWPPQWCWPFTANAAPWPPKWCWPFYC